MRPSISVVVPAYNEEKCIGRLLKSLQEQEFAEEFEVIVVNNGSTDSTALIAKSFGVRLVEERQKGLSRAMARGCNEANGQVICMTDADCVVTRDWLNKIWSRYVECPECVAVGGIFYFYDAPFLLDVFVRALMPIMPRIFIANLVGANMSFKAREYKAVGGFDPGSNLQADNLLVNKLKSRGRIFLDKRVVVYTSSRRYKRGVRKMLGEVMARMINAISIKITGRVVFGNFEDVR